MQAKINIKGRRNARNDEDEDEEPEQQSQSEAEQDEEVGWKAQAYVTGVNYHVKKMVFLLFINSTSINTVTERIVYSGSCRPL